MKKILEPGKNCQGIYDVVSTGILIDGKNYYRAFYNVARRAKQYLLMAGWQFERNVRLLRDREEKETDSEIKLLPFLNELCRKNRQLQIFILMWDFSALVALDKEWFNKWMVDVAGSDRIHFRFDGKHPIGASHHQKFIVVDGAMAFVGGLDICANSWDDRRHQAENAERIVAAEHYEPYHDVQSFHTGPLAWELTQLFKNRWIHAGGVELALPAPQNDGTEASSIKGLISLPAKRVAVSLTRGQTLIPMLNSVHEIRQLYCSAIAAAEKLIYIENQYFSSRVVYEALKERMTDKTRIPPQIILILPKRLHTIVEDISLSIIQTKILLSLRKIANENNVPFGVYYTASLSKEKGSETATYIHSKVLLVDDRFLTVGSANITNRSMGIDTELNVSWEAHSETRELARAIGRIRENLLAEHMGIRKPSERRKLIPLDGLVRFLDIFTERPECRLRRHSLESFPEDISWIKGIVPENLSIDPERALIEESVYEMISGARNGVFAKGILFLNELALQQSTEQLESKKSAGFETGDDSGLLIHAMGHGGELRWYVLAAIALGIAVIIWFLIGAGY